LSVPARTTVTIIGLLSSIMVYSRISANTTAMNFMDALAVWAIIVAASALVIFIRVHWLRLHDLHAVGIEVPSPEEN
jgi:hypothetical protein